MDTNTKNNNTKNKITLSTSYRFFLTEKQCIPFILKHFDGSDPQNRRVYTYFLNMLYLYGIVNPKYFSQMFFDGLANYWSNDTVLLSVVNTLCEEIHTIMSNKQTINTTYTKKDNGTIITYTTDIPADNILVSLIDDKKLSFNISKPRYERLAELYNENTNNKSLDESILNILMISNHAHLNQKRFTIVSPSVIQKAIHVYIDRFPETETVYEVAHNYISSSLAMIDQPNQNYTRKFVMAVKSDKYFNTVGTIFEDVYSDNSIIFITWRIPNPIALTFMNHLQDMMKKYKNLTCVYLINGIHTDRDLKYFPNTQFIKYECLTYLPVMDFHNSEYTDIKTRTHMLVFSNKDCKTQTDIAKSLSTSPYNISSNHSPADIISVM